MSKKINLDKFKRHNKTQEQIAKIGDIKVDAYSLGEMKMDEVIKLALKASKNSKNKNIKPIDRVLAFLQQEQKLMQEAEEKKRQKALLEIIEEQKNATK